MVRTKRSRFHVTLFHDGQFVMEEIVFGTSIQHAAKMANYIARTAVRLRFEECDKLHEYNPNKVTWDLHAPEQFVPEYQGVTQKL